MDVAEILFELDVTVERTSHFRRFVFSAMEKMSKLVIFFSSVGTRQTFVLRCCIDLCGFVSHNIRE